MYAKRLFFSVLLILSFLFIVAASPLQEAPPDFTSLAAVLAWLAGAGGPYFVGWVLSLLAENWPAWHNLPRGVKFISPLAASAVVAILATLALQQVDFLELASPWYTIVAGAVMGYLGSQKAYLKAKEVGYGANVNKG